MHDNNTDAETLSDDSDHESDLLIVEDHYSSTFNDSEANIHQSTNSQGIIKKKSFRFMSKVAEGVRFVVDSIAGKLISTNKNGHRLQTMYCGCFPMHTWSPNRSKISL